MHLLHVGLCTKGESKSDQVSVKFVKNRPQGHTGKFQSPEAGPEIISELRGITAMNHQLHVCISNSIPTPAITGLLKIQNPPSRALHFAQEGSMNLSKPSSFPQWNSPQTLAWGHSWTQYLPGAVFLRRAFNKVTGRHKISLEIWISGWSIKPALRTGRH